MDLRSERKKFSEQIHKWLLITRPHQTQVVHELLYSEESVCLCEKKAYPFLMCFLEHLSLD